MELVKDDEKTYKDKNLIRRRFYLSKESLKYFDALVIANNKTFNTVRWNLKRNGKERLNRFDSVERVRVCLPCSSAR